MTLRRGLSVLSATTIAMGLTAACGGGAPREAQPEAPPAPAAAESPVAVNEKWRAKHEADYRRDWVTIAGLHPLEAWRQHGRQRRSQRHRPARSRRRRRWAGSCWTDKRVRFEPAPGAAVVAERSSRSPQPVDLRDDRTPKADELVIGDVRLVVHVSGETRSLRVRDPNGALARGFLGFTLVPDRLAVPRRRPLHQGRAAAGSQGAEHVRRRSTSTRPRASSSSACSGRRFGCGRSRRGRSASISCSGTRRADRKPTKPRASCMPICSTMGRRCWTSTRRTTRRARSTRTRRVPIPIRENRLPVKILAGEKDYPVHVPPAIGGKL